jgi:outer membrane murein-binding lipoprotein Lpp
MSECDDLHLGQSGETEGQDNTDPPPDDPQPRGAAGPQRLKELSCLPAIIPPPQNAERTDERRARRSGWFSRSGTALAAAVAFAAFGAGAGALVINDHRREAALIAEHAHQTQSLARTVDALAARLSAIDSAKAHDELIELRRSVGEIRSSSASSQELSAALAQLSQRVERLDREDSARVDKLGERFGRDAGAQVAELSARIEKLEKKVVAAAPPPPSPPQSPPVQSKLPALPPKFGANVSMETTGSIERPRPLLRRYVVLGARDDVALIGGREGEYEVRPGDVLPGAGRVERIEREGGGWVVLTDQGLIGAADPPY